MDGQRPAPRLKIRGGLVAFQLMVFTRGYTWLAAVSIAALSLEVGCGGGAGKGPGGPGGGGRGGESVSPPFRVFLTAAHAPPGQPAAERGSDSSATAFPTAAGHWPERVLGPGRYEAADTLAAEVNTGPRLCETTRGVDPARIRGVCLTPSNLGGWADKIELEGQRGAAPQGMGGIPEPSRCGPGRLVAINSFIDHGERGRSGGLFDLLDPKPIGGNTALNCEEYPQTDWNVVSVGMVYLDATFSVGPATWTVRFVFEPNPLDVDPVISDPACMLGAPYIDRQRFLPASIRVARGDVLLCKKNDGSACADADFQWLDTTSKTLTSSRPASALQAPFMNTLRSGKDENGNYLEIFCHTMCERSAPYCGYNVGGYGVRFSIPAERTFRLFSDEWVTDQDPRHPGFDPARLAGGSDGGPSSGDGRMEPGEDPNALPPEAWYRFRPTGGSEQQGPGSRMDVYVTFDTTDFLFIEGLEDPGELDDLSDAELLSRLHIRDMFARDFFTNFGHQPVYEGWVEVRFRSGD